MGFFDGALVGEGVTGALVGAGDTGEDVTGALVELSATENTRSSLSSQFPLEQTLTNGRNKKGV